ncbi:MAG TPA: hypothetical protein ENI08_03425 [Candidatus Dependentiae bacterium]|nr:hypothetical protein [Candidatus Dependentiae bacterium]
MNTDEIMWALSKRYNDEAYAFIPQVRNGTGYALIPRTADLIVVGLWPSRGIELEGFEVKASRSDWLNELKHPAKAESIAKYCDRWWLVVGDKDIVKEGELPSNWGLLVPRGKQLIVKVAAPKLKSVPITSLFMAAIMRRVAQINIPCKEIKKIQKKTKEDTERHCEYIWKYEKERLEKDVKRLKEFEKELGSTIGDYWLDKAREHGKLFKRVANGDFNNLEDRLLTMKDVTKNIFKDISKQLSELSQNEKSNKNGDKT